MTDDLRHEVRAFGNALTPAMFGGTQALYAPHALKPDAVGCTVERDIAYGPDARHRLDIFRPAEPVADAPVLVYVHGGGFIQGDKGGADAPFYNNVGAWAAANGMIGVTLTYRLAPAHQWPAGAEDLGAAVAWLRDNIGAHGGSAERIFVSGQSAGAAHVATYLALPDLHGDGPAVAGAIMLSGFYDPTRAEHSPFEHAYYGTDPSRFAAQNAIPGLVASAIPCLFTIAEYDAWHFQNQAALVVREWTAAKREWPRMLYLPDGNHMTAALGIGRAGDPLSAEIKAFIHKFG
ncbi:MAG TPA: alpha/beta hydrolase [Allosphingosinicella sp.]|nr:alpha/beta hydrolase [Allosphingosinicella sp.]